MKKLLSSLVAILTLASLGACGGGGAEPQAPQAVIAPTILQQPQTTITKARVVPTLLHGAYAEFEVAGNPLRSFQLTAGAFTDIAEKTCSGGTSYAQNKQTGLLEIYCLNGSTFRYNTETRVLAPGAAIPKSKPYLPSSACADDGTCFFGDGYYLTAHFPSVARVHMVDVYGNFIDTREFPDENQMRVPRKMGVVRLSNGRETLVAVSVGFVSNDIAIHRFDVATKKFVGTACTIKAEQESIDIGQKYVVLTLRRGVTGNESDALVIDPETCTTMATPRIPVDTVGVPIAHFAVQSDDAIYLGGGSEWTTPAGPFGVWKFDIKSFQNTGFLPTTSHVFAGVFEKGRGKLWVATKGNEVLEVDAATMATTRIVSEPLYGGDMFLAE